MQVEIEFFVYRGEEEIALTIWGDVEPYVPANLSGHPDDWTPPEGGYSCVEAIFLNGRLWDGKLTAEERKDAEEVLYNALEDYELEPDDYDDYIDDDRADYLYDPFI